MARYIVIDEDGLIVNAVAWDGETEWVNPEGSTVLQNDSYDIGGTLVDDEYTPPTYPEAEVLD